MLSNETVRTQFITRRTFILSGCKAIAFSLVASRVFYMQVIDANEYKALSDQNSIRVVLLHPNRGNILDCKGRLVATSRPSFNVILDKHGTKDYKKSLTKLFAILSTSHEEQEAILTKIKKVGLRLPLLIMSDISWQNVTSIEEDILALDGVYIEMGQVRQYPYGYATSHLIGYTAVLNDSEKKELGVQNIGYFHVGKSGIEKSYDSNLRGNFGVKKTEVNAHGMQVRELAIRPSESGQDLTLNIDAELQRYAYSLLPDTGGSAVVTTLSNGRIIAAACKKGFDPNQFTHSMPQSYWDAVNDDPYTPLINRLVQSNYPPGSIFKILTVLAALENQFDPSIKVRCGGQVSTLGNRYFRCWHKTGHGELDMHGAIQHSCNTYMYYIAKTIGGTKILDIARKFGLGNPTGIDIPSEASGFVPSASWKWRRFGSKWTLADDMNIAIGQGPLLVTPIQLAQVSSIIANNGTFYEPRIHGTGTARFTSIDPQHIAFIKNAMWHAVNSPGGTAYHSRVLDPQWLMAGKTGTAQVQSKHGDIDLNSKSVDFFSRNHAVFLGFAPFDNPVYSVAILIDHGGGGGGVAAPVARDIVLKISAMNNI